jgi:phage-related protein
MLKLKFAPGAQRDFMRLPRAAIRVAGQQLLKVQFGSEPGDWKPMPTIGPGVKEIRIWLEDGTFRIIYVVKSSEGVFVLHSFAKKSQATPKRDIDLARKRLKEIS